MWRGEITFGVVSVAPRSPPPGDSSTLCRGVSVAVIDATASITGDLSGDRTAVTPRLSCDLGWIKVLL